MHHQSPEVDTRDLRAVQAQVLAISGELFPNSDSARITNPFTWTHDAFTGRHPNYLPIDAKYHDLEHTLQGTLALARLLRGYSRAQGTPALTARAFELGIVAILLHDTGYLKHRSDPEGTGAKYTLVHVARSADFANSLLAAKGFLPEEIRAVQNMIRCTGVNAELSSIPFQSDLERNIGYALGTADLLGQMAARDYIDKLESLYEEFAESNRYNGKTTGAGIFTSAADLRARTPIFWQNNVLPKIEKDFRGMYQFLAEANGRNPYLEKIEANIARLQRELVSAAA